MTVVTPPLPQKDDASSSEQQQPSSSKKDTHKNSNHPSILPGIALCASTAFGGFQIASVLSSVLGMPISGIPTSILLGMTLKHTALPSLGNNQAMFQPGVTVCTKTLLQTGIVCVAAKLSFGQVLATSSQCIPVVLSSVGAGMLFVPMAGRWAGLPSSQLTLLLTAGTSICGVTAITALAPAIQASPRDIAVAVANTVLFGTFGMLCYPYLLHSLCDGNSAQVGMCLGVAIHDTSQVLGSALAYKETYGDDHAFQVAAVTKLLRNLGLAVAIPVLSYAHASEQRKQKEQQGEPSSPESSDSNETSSSSSSSQTMSGLVTFTKKYVPPFLLAFLGMSTLRSTGDLLLVESSSTAPHYFTFAMDWLGNDLSKYLLGTAMAGVGLSTSASSLRGVGWKPFAVGGAGALVVGGTGFTVATMIV